MCASVGLEDLSVNLQQLVQQEQLPLQEFDLTIGYDQLSAEEVIRVRITCCCEDACHTSGMGHLMDKHSLCSLCRKLFPHMSRKSPMPLKA